jgi:hypothetical protein
MVGVLRVKLRLHVLFLLQSRGLATAAALSLVGTPLLLSACGGTPSSSSSSSPSSSS